MIVIVPPQEPPSPAAQDLGAKIAQLVQLVREENPDVTAQDVQQAFQLARERLRGELAGVDRQRLVLIIGAVLGLLLAAGFFVFRTQGGGDWPMVAVTVGVLVVGLLAVAIVAAARK
jgi:hypothetical protein